MEQHLLLFKTLSSSKPEGPKENCSPISSHLSSLLLVPRSSPHLSHTFAHFPSSFLLFSFQSIYFSTETYLYGMCLLPLTRARITFPRADRERHRGAELGEEFSLLFPPPPPSTLTSQLPRSSRWRRLRPPDTKICEKQFNGKSRQRTVTNKGDNIVLEIIQSLNLNVLMFYIIELDTFILY